jgi:hypothetical protein
LKFYNENIIVSVHIIRLYEEERKMNITLSADKALIEKIREYAKKHNTT